MAQFIPFIALLSIFTSAQIPPQNVPDFVLLEIQEPEIKSFDEILGFKATALDFGLGFMKGLYQDTDNSKCADYWNDLREHLRKVLVYLELQHLQDRSKIELVYELVILQTNFSQLMDKCNIKEQFSRLSSKLSHINLHNLLYSYQQNSSEISKYLLNLLLTCHIDSGLCGQNFSNILKLLTEFESEYGDSIDIALDIDKLVSGFIKGLKRPMTQEVCMDTMNTLHTNIDSITVDLYNVIQLKEFGFILTLVKDYQVAIDNYKAIVLDCPFDELVETLKKIPTREGVKNLVINMFINYDVLIKDYQNLTVCTQDWEMCGFSISEVLRVVLKWGI